MNKKRMKWEFEFLIDRCNCSQKSLEITPEEAEAMNKEFGYKGTAHEIKPVKPSCTPEMCFPNLYKLLMEKEA